MATEQSSAKQSPFTPDLSLVRQITPAVNVGPVQLDHFHQGNKHLYYIGTHHSTDWDNKTHAVIDQAASKYAPQLVIVEGIETELGLSPDLGFDPKNPHHAKEFMYRREENIHIAEAARLKHIPFIGGEPSTQKIFQALETKGYSTKDIMALYLVRMIPIWRRLNRLGMPENFPKLANDYLNCKEFNHIPQEARLTFDEFKTFYESHKAEMGNKDFLKLTMAEVNASHAPDANYFQKMNKIRMQLRDENLLKVIAESFADYDKVMVVYGNAHKYIAEPVLEKMFGGKASVEKLILSEVNGNLQEPPAAPSPAASTPPQTIHTTVTILPKPDPTTLSTLFKYSTVALLAVGLATALMGSAPIIAGILLASSAVAFVSSKLTHEKQREPSEVIANSHKLHDLPATREGNTPVYNPSRGDGKSWTITSQLPTENKVRSI